MIRLIGHEECGKNCKMCCGSSRYITKEVEVFDEKSGLSEDLRFLLIGKNDNNLWVNVRLLEDIISDLRKANAYFIKIDRKNKELEFVSLAHVIEFLGESDKEKDREYAKAIKKFQFDIWDKLSITVN